MNMTDTVKRLMYRGGRYQIPVPPVTTGRWNEDARIAYVDQSGEWLPDIIDRIMERKSTHVQYLKDLFAAMHEAGFTGIHIDDEDLEPYSVEEDGAEKVIREMFQIDGPVILKANYPPLPSDIPPYDIPYRVAMVFILENDAWESLADHTIPCEAAAEDLSSIVHKLEEKYL